MRWGLWRTGEQGLGLERLRRRVQEVGRKPEGGRRVLHGITQPFRLMSREAPLHETVGWEPNQSGQRGKDKKKKWK